jgi:RecB family endonuclease NucS
MSPPCSLREEQPGEEALGRGAIALWVVQHGKTDDRLEIEIHAIESDSEHELGEDPGLEKDGIEAHLQELLAEQIGLLGKGYTLVRREHPTAIGPVDILARDGGGRAVAIVVKRRGEVDGVEQLSRYLDLLNRDPLISPVEGVFAAQEIKPQARTLAEDRGIRCVLLDYEALRGTEIGAHRLF